jgi:hypothetical protein
LLRSAAQADEEVPAAMPFGFDTRVVALWRAGTPKANGVMQLLRRVAVLSIAVIVISTDRGNSRSKSKPRNPRIVRE